MKISKTLSRKKPTRRGNKVKTEPLYSVPYVPLSTTTIGGATRANGFSSFAGFSSAECEGKGKETRKRATILLPLRLRRRLTEQTELLLSYLCTHNREWDAIFVVRKVGLVRFPTLSGLSLTLCSTHAYKQS